jgi:osmotically-inducible protein OsmY
MSDAALRVVARGVAPHPLTCSEVWGSNSNVAHSVELPGLQGWVYSAPIELGQNGGDIHYLSVCDSGVLCRVALADISGHGRAVSAVAEVSRNLRHGRTSKRAEDTNMLYRGFVVMTVALLTAHSPALAQSSPEDQKTVEQIRSSLLRLPYYGVFDLVAFRYDKGKVTLSGFAYRSHLKKDAVNAVKRIPRVDEVVEHIEELSISRHDEDIRWATFYAIYNDAFLSRYAPGGGLSAFDRRFEMSRFPGMEPLGMYPIHIVVNRGRTLLFGTVDSEADKLLVWSRARTVPGTFDVENAIEVVAAKKSGTP